MSKGPGHPVDLEEKTDVMTPTRVRLSEIRYGHVLADDSLRVRGPTRRRRAFRKWLGLSLFAKMRRPA